jgi:hypothetical protein
MTDSLPHSGIASKTSIEDPEYAAQQQRDVELALAEKSETGFRNVSPREGMPTWKWISTMTGLYLAAMLYGTVLFRLQPKLAKYIDRVGHYYRCRCPRQCV